MKTLPLPSGDFALRLSLTAALAGAAHQVQWADLRFFVSQAILSMSRALSMGADRISFDTIQVQGHLIQFTVACTWVELMLGIQPLLWRKHLPLLQNLLRGTVSMGALFAVNLLRIESAQILFNRGVPWVLAHDIPLGAIYFAIWVFVWRTRDWPALHISHRRLVPASS